MSRKKKKLVYVGFKFRGHGKHAGYDIIQGCLNYDRIIDCQWSYDLLGRQTLLIKAIRVLFGIRLWWIEWYLILLSVFNRNTYIFHIVYPENIYKHLGLFKNGNDVVVTVHQTPQYFDLNPQHLRWLGRASKLIVMSASLEEYFKMHFPSLPVKFIPHPVDTDFFKMNGQKENQVILVGNWLRDHQFAQNVFSKLHSDLKIFVVTAKANWHYYDSNKIPLKSGISDEELLYLYQRSKVVFLPLTSYTANNALAEAISCGCKVVIASDHLDFGVFKIKSNPVTVRLEVQKAIDLIESEMRNWNEDDAKKESELAKGYYSNDVIGRETALYLIS